MAEKKKAAAGDDKSAPPSSQADDYAGDKQYVENPDKPGPDSVAQLEVLPEDK